MTINEALAIAVLLILLTFLTYWLFWEGWLEDGDGEDEGDWED